MSKSRTERLLSSSRPLELGAGFGLLLSLGCATYGSHLSATPVARGTDELSLSADALVIDRGFGPQIVPNPEVGWRHGWGDDFDVGGRANLAGVEANGRLRVLDGEWLDLAVVPGAGFGFVPATNADSGLFNLSALGALLAGVQLQQRSQLVLGPRGIVTYAFPLTAFGGDTSGAKLIYLVGGTLGVRFPVGETTWLFPDVNVLVPYDSDRKEWYFPSIQGGVALQFE